jgi:hypothetical protein
LPKVKFKFQKVGMGSARIMTMLPKISPSGSGIESGEWIVASHAFAVGTE